MAVDAGERTPIYFVITSGLKPARDLLSAAGEQQIPRAKTQRS
jgi:hypothetical protein